MKRPLRALILLVLTGFLFLPADTVHVEKVNEAGLTRLFTANKNQVLVINIWATWCKPCREEFPDFLKLQDFFKEKEVRIISISADYPDEIHSKIIPFLKSFKLNFPVYVQDFKKQDDFINRFHKNWSGALPATFIYDKAGKQKIFLTGKRDFTFFKDAIEKLL